MLDAIVSQIKTEIAIEGPKGVSRDELWGLVQEVATKLIRDKSNNDSIQPTVDDTYKRFLWPFIVKLSEINYFEDTAQPMDLDPQQPPADMQPEHPQQGAEKTDVAPEDKEPATGNANDTPKKRKAPKKQPVKKKKPAKKPKKKPAGRKKKPADEDDYSSDEFQPDSEEESDEESDLDVDAENESDGGVQEDEEDTAAAIPNKNGSGNPSQKSVDTSGYQPIKNLHTLSYDEVEQRYGSRLRLVAGEELQKEQIYVGLPPGRPLSLNLQVVLAAILRTRYSGLTQIAITKELDLDPRSSGHYVKSLEQRGAIIRKPIVASGSRTNLCVHIRYNRVDLIQKKVAEAMQKGQYSARNVTATGVTFTAKMLRTSVVELLSGAPDNIMYSDDILSALGFNPKDSYVKKWYHRSLDSMCSKNVFRKLKPPATGARTSRLLQLVDPNQASKEQALISKNAFMEYNPSVDEDRQLKGCAGLLLTIKDVERPARKGLMYDMSAEPQLLDALYEAGVAGATQKDLGYTMGYNDSRSLYKCLEKLAGIPKNPNATRFTICRNFEFEGRIRRYRYFTYQAYMKVKEGKDVEATGPPKLPIKENELIEVDHRKGITAKKSSRSSKAASQSRRNATEKTPAATETQPVQKRSRRTTVHAITTENQPATRTTRAQPLAIQTIVDESNSMEEDTVEASASETADTQKPPTMTVSESLKVLASIFLPKKRTHSQALATEEDTHASTQPTQAADDNADTTVSTPEPPKRRRQTRAGKNDPKENNSSKQQPVVSQVPERTNTPEVVPVAEEAPKPVETPATPSSTTATGSHRRRNLFDYFSSSRQSPTPEPINKVQVVEALPTVPRNPGTLYQCLVASSLEENTSVPEGLQTIDTVPDKEIEELLAHDASTNTENEAEVEKSPETAVDPMDMDDVSNVRATPESEAVPAAVSVSASSAEKIKISKKQQHERIIRTKDGIVSSRHHSTDDRNSYLVTRKKILLELLQEHRILDRSKETIQIFLAKYKDTYGDVKMIRNLDIKTFWRTATSIVEDGDAQITNVESVGLTNKIYTKSVLVHNDLDLNGPELKAYKEVQSRKRVLNSSRGKMNKFDRFDKDVERLSERIARMEDTHDTIKENSSSEARRLLGDIRLLRSNVQKATELSEKANSRRNARNWLIVSIQYGFIASRLIRVKLFHQYLLDLLYRGGEDIDQDKRTIQPSAFINNMPLGLCLQVIGFFESNASLREFTKDSSNLEIRLADIPEDLKELLMTERNRFRRRLRGLLDHLLLLKVVGITGLDGEVLDLKTLFSTLAPVYVLHETAAIIDYWSPDRRVIREYRIETTTDALVYWSELQYFCTNGAEQRTQPVAESPEEEQMIRSLTAPRNWSTAYVFSREQREKLNTYVNKETGETPFKKTSACKDIAKSMDVPVAMVMNYFRKMENAIKRKLDKPIVRALEYAAGKKRRRRKPRTQMEMEGTGFSQSAKHIFKKTERGSTVRRLLRAQKVQGVAQNDQSQKLYLDDENTLPTVDENLNISSLKLRRTTARVSWSMQEDELLVYSYVILKSRALRCYSRFYWNMLEMVLPDRPGQVCRHRFAKLKIIPKVAEHISNLFISWDVFYTEGVCNGDIEDKDIHDMVHFDFLGHLAYFIKRIQASKDEIKVNVFLPSSREELEANYEVRTGALEEDQYVYYEDTFHNCTSLVQKHDIMCGHYLGFRGYELGLLDIIPDDLVPERTESKRILQLIMVFIRMILFTPDEMYDPFFAYGVLHQYPQDLAQLAVENMRSYGQLVYTKGSRNNHRRIPGYVFGISERYLSNMASEMPDNFHVQASEYEKYLASNGVTKYSPEIVSSGMMGCILNLLSIDKLNFSIFFENIQWMKHKIPLYRTRMIDERLTNVVFSVEGHDIADVPVNAKAPEVQVQIKDLDAASHASRWLGFHSQQRKEVQPVLVAIKAYLDNVKGTGADMIEIKENVLAKLPETNDYIIRECMDILCTASPPLAHQVGFSVYRYVLTTYLRDWVVLSHDVSAPEPRNKDIAARTKDLLKVRKEVIVPRIWHDLNGNTTAPAVVNGCMTSVLERVLARPGIRERDVHRLFKNMLTYVEVKDALEELVRRGALRKTVTSHTGVTKVTLFSKRRSYSAVDPATISRNSQTCYWATPDYYRVLATDVIES